MTIDPPFRADIVGSFLRPDTVKKARLDHAEGRLDDAGLVAIEDDAIRALVAEQVDAGLSVVTDGELRRAWWHYDFFGMLHGVEVVEQDHGIQFQGVETRSQGLRVTGPISFPGDHPMLEHFRFLASVTPDGALPKMAIPAPSVLHFRLSRSRSGLL